MDLILIATCFMSLHMNLILIATCFTCISLHMSLHMDLIMIATCFTCISLHMDLILIATCFMSLHMDLILMLHVLCPYTWIWLVWGWCFCGRHWTGTVWAGGAPGGGQWEAGSDWPAVGLPTEHRTQGPHVLPDDSHAGYPTGLSGIQRCALSCHINTLSVSLSLYPPPTHLAFV